MLFAASAYCVAALPVVEAVMNTRRGCGCCTWSGACQAHLCGRLVLGSCGHAASSQANIVFRQSYCHVA